MQPLVCQLPSQQDLMQRCVAFFVGHVINGQFPLGNALPSLLLLDSIEIRPSNFVLIVDSLGTDHTQDIHSLIGNLLMKDAPICIASKLGNVKHIGHSLKDLDATRGWQWTQVWLYDRLTSHSVYGYSVRVGVIGTPNNLTMKAPNYTNIDQGSCASQITIGIAGWLL